jgi:hypothetical protein
MPTWKKVIVSGSNAHLTSITASQVPMGNTENVLVISTTGEIKQVSQASVTGQNLNSFKTISIGGTGGSQPGGDLVADSSTDTLIISSSDTNLTIVGTAASDTITFDFADSPSFTNVTATGNLTVNGNTTLGDAGGDSVTVNAQTVTLSNQLAATAPSSTMLVITSSNRVATQTLGTGVATFLTTPSSANLAAAVTDETGTGTLVFSASPTFTGTVNAAAITATGNLIVNGNTTLGDASGDSVTVNAQTVTLQNPLLSTVNVGNILVLTSSNRIATQSIDTRVFGSTLIDGSLTANRVPFASDSNTLADDSNFTYNSGTDVLTINSSTFGQSVSVNQNLTVGGNLTVSGTTTTIDTTNLLVEDKFIILAHGSGSISPIAEGGIIVEGSTADKGQAFLFNSGSTENVTGRWGLAADVHATSSDVTPTDFMVSAIQASGAPSSAPTYGGSAGGYGNMYVNSTDESIWIYS